MKTRTSTFGLSLVIFLTGIVSAWSQYSRPGGAINFQGRIYDQGLPANNLYDLNFQLWDAESNGAPVGPMVSLNNVGVSNGYFNVTLDFGSNVFTGPIRWMEIQQRASGGNLYSTLPVRIPTAPTPYAIHALSASTALSVSPGSLTSAAFAPGAVGPSAIAPGAVCVPNLCNNLLNDTFWRLDGNRGTDPNVNFLGTIDTTALTIRVADAPVLRINRAHPSPNIIGGDQVNSIDPTVQASVIGGGGLAASPNTIAGDASVIAGGDGNHIEDQANFIGGGRGNSIDRSGGMPDPFFSVIGGGWSNVNSGAWSTIGGGGINVIRLSSQGDSATIAGGYANLANGNMAAIGGGAGNTAGTAGSVGGGWVNMATGFGSVVAGGTSNIASGAGSAIVAGHRNTATSFGSFIGSGTDNRVDASTSVIAGGQANYIGVTNSLAVIGGGTINTNVGPLATVLNGSGVLADKYGQVAFGTRFAANGDAQAGFYHLRLQTTGIVTNQPMYLDGTGARLTVSLNSAWAFRALVIGKASGATVAAWELKGMVMNNAGTTTVIQTTPALLGGSSSLSTYAAADDVNDALVIRVASSAPGTVRWSAQVETAEVNMP